MSEIRRVNTGDAPRNVYHAGDAPRTVNTGRTVKTGSALNQDEYEAARRRAQQLAANNTRRTRSFNRVQQTDVDRYRAAQQKERKPAPLLPSSRPRKPTLPAKLPRASRSRPLPRASSP